MIPTCQVEEGRGDRGDPFTADSSRRRNLTSRQNNGATRSSQELRRSAASPWRWQFQKRAMLHRGLRSVSRDWLDGLGSHTATLKCDSEPAILASGQEIRRSRREDSITIFEHAEEEEKQSKPLRRGQREHREGPHQNPAEQHGVKSEDNVRPVSPTDTVDH